MTEQQVFAMAEVRRVYWVRIAFCATAALYARPAVASESTGTLHVAANTSSNGQIPEVGFGSSSSCAPNAVGMGRLGGFDLGKLGAQIDAPSFGNKPCDIPTSSARRRDPGSSTTSHLADDTGLTKAQFLPPSPATPSLEDKPAPSKNVFEGTFALIGISVGSIPTYEGSSHSKIMPVPGAIGRVGGVDFRLAGPSLTLDFIKGKPDAKVAWALGPSVRYRFNRSGKTGDAVVDQLGKLKGVIELGANAGVSVRRVLTKYDLLSVGVSARWDVSGRGSGMIFSPTVSYLMPVSKAQVVGALVSADFVDQRYAKYNYSVTPAGSAASGLPVHTAKGGFKLASVGAFTARDLSGNILDGGFAIGVGAMYSKLYGSAAKTPITALRGKRSQWIFGGGLIYTF